MPNNLNRRFGEVIAGLLLLLVAFSAGGSSELTGILFAIAGFYLLARQFDRTRRRDADPYTRSRRDYDRQRERDTSRRTRSAPPVRPQPPERDGEPGIYRHALEAVRRAGHDPETMKVLPVDIGLMVFREAHDPQIYRTREVPDDADYVQPFIQLRMPVEATGRVRFEILDQDGDPLFVHEDNRALERGLNLLSPAARLPVHDDQQLNGQWTLRVSAEGVTIAEHQFGWDDTSTPEIRLSEDGEITHEMRAMLATNRLESMSLDELLSDQQEDVQEEAAPRQRQRRGG